MDIVKFWAKTSPDKEKPNAFHPLICHLIDVAAVTHKIWREVLPTATKKRIAEAFGETNFDRENLEKAGSTVAFIAGLHDLGKCSPPFTLRGKNECKKDLTKILEKHGSKENTFVERTRGKLQTVKLLQLYQNSEFDSSSVKPAMEAPHGYVTAVELPQILVEMFDFNNHLARQISVMIGGHHGVFPSSQKLIDLKSENCIGRPVWASARKDLADKLAEVFKIKPLQRNSGAKLDNGTIMIIAGLVSVADWIGSDAQFFNCAIADFTKEFNLDLEEYAEQSKTTANKALKELGWLNWSEIEQPKQFYELFPDLKKYPPRGLQREAIEIAGDLKTAGIVVVESPMGEGKTEAAMFLADTWNANLRQRGIYFALPTQATSNQMFGRVKKFLGERFDKKIVNFQLTHGHSSLSAEFDTLKKDSKKIQDVYEECSGDECVPHVVAAEWFTYRKRGLLAPFGVGTVDQALMAVLQTKHVFVRLFGLAHKTVIIDEVHAYDAYMSTLLERLLEWLAALGSPVILLSATLPKNRRDALVKAYQRGLNAETRASVSVPTDSEDVYPRISYATDSTIKVRHINSSTKTQILHIKKVDDENFIHELKAKLKNKRGCVAIICNTVKRSQDIYELLEQDEDFKGDAGDGLPKLDLLHSRFRFCDRDRIENKVRLRFGKQGEKVKFSENGEDVEKEVKRPDFAVLVSTQIIEQSLDIDFDLMISDLAPVDLLLQRAGRLHRHDRKRENEFKDATLWIIEPNRTENNLPNFENSSVYDEHILLRTWLILRETETIEIPNEIEDLIELVYDKKRECFDKNYQEFWDTTKIKMDEKLKAKRLKAKSCRITDCDDDDLFENDILNLDEDNPEVHKTLQALTRDDEMPSVSVVVLTQKETESINLEAKPNKETSEFLLKRETKISKKGLTNLVIADENLKLKSWKTSALLRHHRLLKLNENNEIVLGNFKVSLDENLGIVIEKTGGKNE